MPINNLFGREVERQTILFRDMQDQIYELRQQTRMNFEEKPNIVFSVSEDTVRGPGGLVNMPYDLKYLNKNVMDHQVIPK